MSFLIGFRLTSSHYSQFFLLLPKCSQSLGQVAVLTQDLEAGPFLRWCPAGLDFSTFGDYGSAQKVDWALFCG